LALRFRSSLDRVTESEIGMPARRFDPQALYDAIDAQRRERKMTWIDCAKEMRVSVSTIKGMTKRKCGIELDGVMGMARWLGRTVESFAGGDGGAPRIGVHTKSGRYIRFDTTALFAAVDSERQKRGLTWEQVATEVWPRGPWGASQLKGLSRGGRADVYGALAICTWLDRTIQSFTRESTF
jgi:hypothetical protein